MMITRGEMVKAGASPPMRFVELCDDGMARCLLIDDDGVVQDRFIYFRQLRPMREVFQPRTCWKETGQFDLIEIEREERAAAESRRLQRRAARKARPSNKLKRRAPVMA